MTFTTASNNTLTDETLDEMAREYEETTWEGHGEVTMGRPELHDKDMETAPFCPPRSRISAIEVAAEHASDKEA